MLLFSATSSATEIRLDDSWIPKLGHLCQAAMFSSRMTAEPICAELERLRVQSAEADKATAVKKEPVK